MDTEMLDKAYAKAEKNNEIWRKNNFCIANGVCPKCAGDLTRKSRQEADLAPEIFLLCQCCGAEYPWDGKEYL